ncbi:MAG: tRNA threonylcarbamoyladenosine dehydratase [Melioribacteraceae bacterium]|nr:tRNA threonylcarbamoyladenosine dehydratase [Melioribacteraceae bacterium]
MDNNYWLSRTELLVGSVNIEKLQKAHVLIVGLGGVGAYAAELICRAGVGEITIVDGDKIVPSNINRQLPALNSTLDKEKTEVIGERLKDINPSLKLNIINEYIKDERMIEILEDKYDYVVDAIDTLSPKIYLIYNSVKKGLKIVSSMGAGGKYDPSLVKVADIKKSFNCKLARVVRKRLNRLGISKGFKVVFSPEEISMDAVIIEESENKKSNVGTISYMPPIFGCFCASVVIRDIVKAE